MAGEHQVPNNPNMDTASKSGDSSSHAKTNKNYPKGNNNNYKKPKGLSNAPVKFKGHNHMLVVFGCIGRSRVRTVTTTTIARVVSHQMQMTSQEQQYS